MRTILIRQGIFEPDKLLYSDWSMIIDGRIVNLCWDEMLGMLARVLLNGTSLGERWPLASPIDRSNWIEITELTSYGWTACYRGTFRDHLSSDEMLGFIASVTHPGHELFGGWKTYEEAQKYPYSGLNNEIAGLLTCQI